MDNRHGAARRSLIGLCLATCVLYPHAFASETPAVAAFPGAEGHGAMTRGGRGGRVIAVTTLNDSGPGSLRDAVDAEGPRTVVFRVSGTIVLESRLNIRNPYITIAGQTAPGDGITLRKNQLSIGADEVIIRYMRVRLGDESEEDADAVSGRYHKNIILDHISASWSVDETVSIYHCEDLTVQWCLIAESMYQSHHAKGTHGYGGIWGSNRSTYHHNLLAHHTSRNPRFASGCGYTDYRNNVVYNWGYNSAYGGENEQPGKDEFNFTAVNMVGNYYKPGPATTPDERLHRIVSPSSRREGEGYGKWYVAGNVVEGSPEVTADNWNGGVQPQHGDKYLAELRADEPWDAVRIHEQTAEDAYRSVLAHAGASLSRDAVDTRIIAETRGGYATYEGATYEQNKRVANPDDKSGIIDSPADVGGWPELVSEPAPADTDGDGMPDEWEAQRELDANDASDGSKDRDGDGYTNVEEYINGLVE